MGDQEREIRHKIANEIANKFGSLAPYQMVQDFVKARPFRKTNDKKGEQKHGASTPIHSGHTG